MSGFGERYVVDTNALIRIKARRRANPYFLERAVFPSEVLREARIPDAAALQVNEYPTTPQVLEWLVRVMATVPASDRRLVDLYANRGGADPFVIACALDGRARDSVYLDAPEWFVVTDDDAVRAKATELGLSLLSSTELAATLDAAANEAARP